MLRAQVAGLILLTALSAFAETEALGPVAILGYDEINPVENPIETFMYFIPLTSPVRVRIEKSASNAQKAWITSYELANRRSTFQLECKFAIDGAGHYINVFNPDDIIAFNTKDLESPKATTNLDFMRFDGQGLGSIIMTGAYDSGVPTIIELTFHFDGRGAESPVLLGLYSIEPVDGEYLYENRDGFLRARISSLSFRRNIPGEPPMMRVKMSAIGGGESPGGLFSSIKAAIANLFVPPTEVNSLGNATLFDFAYAILEKSDRFQFPYATNLD